MIASEIGTHDEARAKHVRAPAGRAAVRTPAGAGRALSTSHDQKPLVKHFSAEDSRQEGCLGAGIKSAGQSTCRMARRRRNNAIIIFLIAVAVVVGIALILQSRVLVGAGGATIVLILLMLCIRVIAERGMGRQFDGQSRAMGCSQRHEALRARRRGRCSTARPAS